MGRTGRGEKAIELRVYQILNKNWENLENKIHGIKLCLLYANDLDKGWVGRSTVTRTDTLIKKKRKFSSNTRKLIWVGCKVINEEGLPNI